MRNDTAKMIKRIVLHKMYGEEIDAVQKSHAMSTPKFKAIYRAAKKNYNRKRRYAGNVSGYTISRRQQRLLTAKAKEATV